MDNHISLVIIGAGVSGAITAYYMAEEGYNYEEIPKQCSSKEL